MVVNRVEYYSKVFARQSVNQLHSYKSHQTTSSTNSTREMYRDLYSIFSSSESSLLFFVVRDLHVAAALFGLIHTGGFYETQ